MPILGKLPHNQSFSACRFAQQWYLVHPRSESCSFLAFFTFPSPRTSYWWRLVPMIGSFPYRIADFAVWILKNNDSPYLFYRCLPKNLWTIDRSVNLLVPFVKGNDTSFYSWVYRSLSPFLFAFANWSSKASAGSSVRLPSFSWFFIRFLSVFKGPSCGCWSYRLLCSLRRIIRGFCCFLVASFWGVTLSCL